MWGGGAGVQLFLTSDPISSNSSSMQDCTYILGGLSGYLVYKFVSHPTEDKGDF